MTLPRWRLALVIGIVLAAVVALVRSLRGGPVPAFEAPVDPDWVGPAAAAPDADPLATAPAWIQASEEPPPASHLVKAKLGSGIYHLPGMMNYERTRPDRYYRTAAEAEADGLRAAKR